MKRRVARRIDGVHVDPVLNESCQDADVSVRSGRVERRQLVLSVANPRVRVSHQESVRRASGLVLSGYDQRCLSLHDKKKTREGCGGEGRSLVVVVSRGRKGKYKEGCRRVYRRV